jgi:outer membrane lipopolysaccharide assembly protein LptE/RlpB
MKTLAALLAALALLLTGGCGYHVPTAGDSWAGEGGRTLCVELFANRTTEPYLDSILTDEVSVQLSRLRLVELTERCGSADLRLGGTITSFSSSNLAYNPNDEVSEYSASVAATAQLVRREDGKVLWQGNLSRSETYSAQDNKSQQQAGESLAARTASRRLAEDLVARLLEDF